MLQQHKPNAQAADIKSLFRTVARLHKAGYTSVKVTRFPGNVAVLAEKAA